MEGPEFLTNERKSWPERLPNRTPCDATVKQEEKKVQAHTTTELKDTNNRLDPKRYSSLKRLIRVTAWLKRFVKNCKSPVNAQNMSTVLQNDKLTTAETFWLRRAQAESFTDKQNDKRLSRFSPMLDKDGLLRVDGRLRLAEDLPYDTRHPIILPKRSSDYAIDHIKCSRENRTWFGNRTSSDGTSFAILAGKRKIDR